MHFGPTAAQEELRGRVRGLFAGISPSAEVRRLMETDTGFDPQVWEAVQGFVRGGWLDLSVVLEEAGRVLLPAPYLATATAAPFLPDDVGPCVATLALAEAAGRWDDAGVQTRAVGSQLEGEKSYVVDGCVADVLVVAARREDGDVGLFLVDGDAPGLDRRPLNTVDQTRRQATVTLAATPARPLPGTLDSAVDLCAVALAAEQVGGAERCLEAAVEHAGRRVQFGRPVGSFQAVKHLCAEMLLELESARSAAFVAAAAAAGNDPELPTAASVAKACCSEAYVRVATDSLHVHGGLGFTWDHDAHLYFKRARSSRLLFGDPNFHRERLARQLGL
ncbi:MAG TPA: acyl-CoA dehydrogenase [Acidimicrobiales bacterium]|nr:acyl-CoA dehydrogenase [Acidimicrobiales bacterium]